MHVTSWIDIRNLLSWVLAHRCLWRWIVCFYSPPVRWGLLDFMLVSSPPPVLLYSSFLLLLSSPSSSDLICDPVSSVWRAGPQPRAHEFSVACRTPTAILRVQCGVPAPNCDLVSSVWRAGPQLRSCEFSVACRTPTAIMRVQCGVPDSNRELGSSVWRAGPQLWWKGLVVVSRWNQLGASCGWEHDAVPQHAGTSRRRLGSR